MVSTQSIAGLCLSLAIAVFAPFVVFIVYRRRATLSLRNVAVGAAIFILFALVLEPALHVFVLRGNPASAAFFHVHRLAFALYGALAAGVFEESGRYLGLRFAVKPTGNPGTALAYGLGHGGAESILIGVFGIAQGIVFAILMNKGKLDTALAALHLPAPAAMKVRDSLIHLTFGLSVVGGVERLIAIALQIALSFIVWNAVQTRRASIVVVAVGLHMFADLGAALLQAGLVSSIAVAEGWALLGLVVTAGLARTLNTHSPPHAA